MNGNTVFRYSNVSLLSICEVTAPVEVTSAEFDERLAEPLKRLRLPTGLLERVAGVRARRNWEKPGDYIEGGAEAGRRALSAAGVDAEQIGLLINGSVSREALEPAMSVYIHEKLGLPTSAMTFDITNACMGFVNSMTMAASLIEAGQFDYALITATEDVERVQDATVEHLKKPGITRDEYLEVFASLTLGCGAVAAVLGRSDLHPEGHRIAGGVTRAGTWGSGLCVGDFNGMFTDSKGLLEQGTALVMDAWDEAHENGWDWRDMDRYVMHQVSSIHTEEFAKRTGVDRAKIPVTYPELGNVGPAALPITLAREVEKLDTGDRVLLQGVGSGLNAAMIEIEW